MVAPSRPIMKVLTAYARVVPPPPILLRGISRKALFSFLLSDQSTNRRLWHVMLPNVISCLTLGFRHHVALAN